MKGDNMEIQAISSSTAAITQSQSTNESTSTSKASKPAPPKAGGAPPTEDGAKPAASNGNSITSTSATKIYDKRDVDQDGVVSDQEKLLYALQHPTDETQKESTVSTSQVQAGLNAYQQAGDISESSSLVSA
jgi:hypothetical protein